MKNKKIVWVIIGIVAIALIALAITYAYWQITRTQTGENEITTACLDITLADAEEGNTGISLTNQYPLSDTEGAALTPYKFTVTNNCDTEVNYQIALESIGDSTTSMQASSIKVMLDDTDSTKLSVNTVLAPTISGAYASHKLGTATLAATGEEGSSATHELRLWIDEAAPVSENNKTYTGKISVTIGQGIERDLKETILATSTLSKTSDDYGNSYYFSGDVTNNYVTFGEYTGELTKYYRTSTGEYFYSASECTSGSTYSCDEETVTDTVALEWRILRINGNNTIRLIYSGPVTPASGGAQNLGYDEKYVGYTYANSEGGQDDSVMKSGVDEWYSKYLSNYSEYISDTLFCNDRTIKSGVSGGYISYAGQTAKTNFECANKEDRYTVDDTTLGNGYLTYPVGLITADEVRLASSYLETIPSTLTSSMTMTPSFYAPLQSSAGGAGVYYFKGSTLGDGDIGSGSWGSTPDISIPVINLNADVKFTYNDVSTAGTESDPYVITTN